MRLSALFFSILVLSCSWGPKTVYFALPESSSLAAEDLVASLPLSPEYARTLDRSKANVVVSWTVSRSDSGPVEGAWNRPLVASVEWTDDAFRLDPPKDGRWANAYGQPRVKWSALEDVELPRRAVSLGGLWPGDARYPAFEVWKLDPAAPEEWAKRWKAAAVPERFRARLSWVGAVGDVMPGRGSAPLLRADVERAFGSATEVMRSFDLLLANLETAVTDRGTKFPKSYNFRISRTLLEGLRSAGIDWVTIANNHTYDWGEVGLRDTLAALAEEKLPFGGASLVPQDAAVASVLTARDQSVHVWAAGDFPPEGTGFSGPKNAQVTDKRPGIFWADDETVDRWSEAFRKAKAFKVAVIHGGEEWSLTPSKRQVELYRRLVDEGADWVVGHHPHVLQPIEVRGRSLIVYSLGNFLFDGMQETAHGQKSVLFSVGVYRDRIRSFRFWSAALDGPRVSLDPQEKGGRLLWSLSQRWARSLDTPKTNR